MHIIVLDSNENTKNTKNENTKSAGRKMNSPALQLALNYK